MTPSQIIKLSSWPLQATVPAISICSFSDISVVRMNMNQGESYIPTIYATINNQEQFAETIIKSCKNFSQITYVYICENPIILFMLFYFLQNYESYY